MSAAVVKSGKTGSPGLGNGFPQTQPTDVSFKKSTFFAQAATVTLPAGDDGQEITIISTNGSSPVSIVSGTGILGATTLELSLNGAATLRFFSSTNTWYIVSHNEFAALA